MLSDALIRILSVDDHPVMRAGLGALIASQADMLLVGRAATGEEGVAQFRVLRPDITLMDIRLPGISGTDALIAIRGEFPEARIIMLTTSEAEEEIRLAFSAGAMGYVLKSAPRKELFAIIRSVHSGVRNP